MQPLRQICVSFLLPITADWRVGCNRNPLRHKPQEELSGRVCQTFEYVKSVTDLHGLRMSGSNGFGVQLRPVSGNNFYIGKGRKPLTDIFAFPAFQHIHDLACLSIYHHCSIGIPSFGCKIVDTYHFRLIPINLPIDFRALFLAACILYSCLRPQSPASAFWML